MARVILKLQRPMFTNGDNNEVMSYIVDKSGEQVSNPFFQIMTEEEINALFDGNFKVYYSAKYRKGKPVLIKKPVWIEEWV